MAIINSKDYAMIHLKDICNRPKKIKVDAAGITLLNTPGVGGYFIERGRYNTPLSILRWVLHLTEKNWIDRENINEFVNAALLEIEVCRDVDDMYRQTSLQDANKGGK